MKTCWTGCFCFCKRYSLNEWFCPQMKRNVQHDSRSRLLKSAAKTFSCVMTVNSCHLFSVMTKANRTKKSWITCWKSNAMTKGCVRQLQVRIVWLLHLHFQNFSFYTKNYQNLLTESVRVFHTSLLLTSQASVVPREWGNTFVNTASHGTGTSTNA